MKKLLATLLIATMLIASVTCVLAVSAEDSTTDSNILANLLPAAGEGEGYKITANADGSVTIELTAAATEAAPVNIDVTPENFSIDPSGDAFFLVEWKQEGAKIGLGNPGTSETKVGYTRKKNGEESTGYVYLGTALLKNPGKDNNEQYRFNNVTADYVTPEIGYGAFNMGAYIKNSNYVTDSGKNPIVSAQLSLYGDANAKLTVYSMAFVKSLEGLTLGEGKPPPPATT